jgi:hypothetical protein
MRKAKQSKAKQSKAKAAEPPSPHSSMVGCNPQLTSFKSSTMSGRRLDVRGQTSHQHLHQHQHHHHPGYKGLAKIRSGYI